METSNYVVPIYYKGDLNGTGFIVRDLLVTAAHVVVSKEIDFTFLYGEENIKIEPEKNIIFEYPKENSMQGHDNIYWDLAVYKLDKIVSPLELREPDFTKKCLYQGYSDCAFQIDSYNDIILNNKAYFYPPEYDAKPIPVKNCYISKIGQCKPGNSGGPLFQGNYVVGMLVGNQQYRNFSMDRFISSSYILKILSKYDSNYSSYKTND